MNASQLKTKGYRVSRARVPARDRPRSLPQGTVSPPTGATLAGSKAAHAPEPAMVPR